MKHWMVLFSAIIAALSLGMAVLAAPGSGAPAAQTQPMTPTGVTTAPYWIDGKVVGVSKGWLEVEVTKIEKGAGIAAGSKLRISEGRRTKIIRAGKPVTASMLAAGETVEVVGRIVHSGKTTAYQAMTVTILK